MSDSLVVTSHPLVIEFLLGPGLAFVFLFPALLKNSLMVALGRLLSLFV
jgi:hypothetical protein